MSKSDKVQIIDIGEITKHEIRGDDVPEPKKFEPIFDKAQIKAWKKQLLDEYPGLEGKEAMLDEVLRCYSKHPDIIDTLVEERKQGLHGPECVEEQLEKIGLKDGKITTDMLVSSPHAAGEGR